MHDNMSADRDREMDVGSTAYDPTSRSSTATGHTETGYTETGYTETTAGTRYPGTEYAGGAYEGDPGTGTTGGDGVKDKAAAAAKTGAQAASQGAKDVAGTAKEGARNVAGEVTSQARRMAGDVGQQLRGQAQQQHGTMVTKLRQASDDMRQMADGRDSSPATSLVSNLAERTNRFADHLESRGPEGVLSDVQEFARRRPGTFLLAAAAAGFVVGRLGKSVLTAPNSPLSSSGNGATGDRDYRNAYEMGAADTYAGYGTTAAGTTAAGTTAAGTTAAGTTAAGTTTEPIRDDGGWTDPAPEAVGTDPGDALGANLRPAAERSRP
jgi:hypothetical protein